MEKNRFGDPDHSKELYMHVCPSTKKLEEKGKKKVLILDRSNESLVYEASRVHSIDELSLESGDGCSPGCLLNQSYFPFPNGRGIPVTWLTQHAMDNSSVT